jgi:hypothetical protein
MEPSAHAGAQPEPAFNVNFQLGGPPVAGVAVGLTFVVTEQRVGEPWTAFERLHDRLQHLIIVDDQLSHFAHVHPALAGDRFEIAYVFPRPGHYKLWAEVKPTGHEPVLAGFRLEVGGTPVAEVSRPSAPHYQVHLAPAGPVKAHEQIQLDFKVEDEEAKPVTDLEPLMAAGAIA